MSVRRHVEHAEPLHERLVQEATSAEGGSQAPRARRATTRDTTQGPEGRGRRQHRLLDNLTRIAAAGIVGGWRSLFTGTDLHFEADVSAYIGEEDRKPISHSSRYRTNVLEIDQEGHPLVAFVLLHRSD